MPLPTTVGSELLPTAEFSAHEVFLSTVRFHVAWKTEEWFQIKKVKAGVHEGNSRSLAKLVVKVSPHSLQKQLEHGYVRSERKF
jgi:hypothetical protein